MPHHTGQTEASGSAEHILTVLRVPRQADLSPEQVRGACCVWCSGQLTAASADLGRRQGSYLGVYGPWFPRGCDECTRAEARRVLAVHTNACQRCARPIPADCPDGAALSRVVDGPLR